MPDQSGFLKIPITEEKIMRIQNILLVSLFVPLYGCQPSAPKTAAPAEPAAPPAAVLATSAPAAKTESAPGALEAKPEAKSGSVLSEADAMQLAKTKNCLACHTLDKKLVGPAFKEVAAKYRGDAGAEARLVDKVAKGGGGVWGATPMPPNPQASEADRKALVRFILSLQ
jgi:cytochrome c